MKPSFMSMAAFVALVAFGVSACAGDPIPEAKTTLSPVDTATDGVTAAEGHDNEVFEIRPGDPDSDRDMAATPEGSQDANRVADADLPGEEFPWYFSTEGEEAHVFRVPANDVLFVRQEPDPTAEEVGQVDPLGTVTLAGRERYVDSGIWAEVRLTDGVGWVNTSYLSFLREPGEDVTDEFDELGTAEDHAQLAADAVQLQTDSFDWVTPPGPEVVLVAIPEHEPLRYQADITGLQDTSIGGQRLEILIKEVGDRFVIDEVQATWFCSKGFYGDYCL